ADKPTGSGTQIRLTHLPPAAHDHGKHVSMHVLPAMKTPPQRPQSAPPAPASGQPSSGGPGRMMMAGMKAPAFTSPIAPTVAVHGNAITVSMTGLTMFGSQGQDVLI